MKPDRFDIRIPFEQRLWRPGPFLGPQSEEERDKLVLAIDRQQPASGAERLRLPPGHEFRPGYLARVRERICPPAPPEDQAEPMRQLYRIVGEKR